VQFWDWATKTRRAAPIAHFGGANAAAFTSDSKLLATGSADRAIKLWDVTSGTELATLTGHAKPIEGIAISRDDKILASCDGIWSRRDEPGEVKLWDLATRKELITLRDHQGCVFAVAFSPDGKTLATASADQTIKLWDLVRVEANK